MFSKKKSPMARLFTGICLNPLPSGFVLRQRNLAHFLLAAAISLPQTLVDLIGISENPQVYGSLVTTIIYIHINETVYGFSETPLPGCISSSMQLHPSLPGDRKETSSHLAGFFAKFTFWGFCWWILFHYLLPVSIKFLRIA